jgi:hypothetical protein
MIDAKTLLKHTLNLQPADISSFFGKDFAPPITREALHDDIKRLISLFEDTAKENSKMVC